MTSDHLLVSGKKKKSHDSSGTYYRASLPLVQTQATQVWAYSGLFFSSFSLLTIY